MHPNILILTALFINLLLSACSDEPKPKQAAIKPFETQSQVLEQAKQLEQTMQDAAEAKRKEIEAQVN